MLAISASAGRLPLESYISHGSEAGIQWTKVRKAVLHLLWSTAEPLGAYEAAERLSNPGKRVFPTSVYRCLDCLMEAGLVLQIVTWNKFVLPPRPGMGLWAALLCRDCRSCTILDLDDERAGLDDRVRVRGFTPLLYAAECPGRCRRCKPRRLPSESAVRLSLNCPAEALEL
jgi:Fur family zinc uptake transcriptional regulator